MEPDRSAAARRRRGILSSSLQVDRQEFAAIFAGGFIGAVARAALEQGLAVPADRWPWATFTVNMVAALLLGYFVTRLQERLPPYTYRRSFLATGICGALSTFSTMMVELLKMLDAGDWALAGGYAAASIAGGFAAIFLATKLVRRVRFGK